MDIAVWKPTNSIPPRLKQTTKLDRQGQLPFNLWTSHIHLSKSNQFSLTFPLKHGWVCRNAFRQTDPSSNFRHTKFDSKPATTACLFSSHHRHLPVTLVFQRNTTSNFGEIDACVGSSSLSSCGLCCVTSATNCLSSTEAAEYTTLIRPVKVRRSNFLALRKVVKKRPANRAFWCITSLWTTCSIHKYLDDQHHLRPIWRL